MAGRAWHLEQLSGKGSLQDNLFTDQEGQRTKKQGLSIIIKV